MPPPRLINIDPIGNLLIISKVPGKPTPYHFRVSSKTLALASPLFASLFPDAASHIGQYQLVISDDIPETVGTLLELCHFGRTAPLPYAPLKGLYSLAELSQKYALVSPLVPWISIWAEPLHTLGKLDFSNGEDLNLWLTVACVYNQGPLFLKITKQAVLTGSAEILDVSRWKYPYSEIIGLLILFLLKLIPSTLTDSTTDKISPKRIDAISKLTAIALTLLGRYQITESICKQSTNSKECDAILLGSVLKGLMGLGVYQPIPAAPYPGMTVMGLADKIRSFPFMWDAAHADTCGVAIKEEMEKTMKLVAEILGGVNGLDLKKFKFKKGWGQVESLVVTAVEDLDDVIQQGQRQQGHREEVVEVSQVLNRQEEGENKQQEKQEEEEEEEEEREEECAEDQEDEEQEIEERAVGKEEPEEDDGEIEAKGSVEDEGSPVTVIIDTASENGSVASVMTEPPAGVMDGFLETEETVQDFGPQKFFGDTGLDQTTADISFTESPLIDDVPKESEKEEMVAPLVEKTQMEKRLESPTATGSLLIQENDIQSTRDKASLVEQRLGVTDSVAHEKQKEQLRPEAKDFVPSFPLGPAPPERNRHHMPRGRRELFQPPRTASVPQHVASRANAEAKGQQWQAPGPELVQKYQRGPRSRFHPEVTVRDVSETGHVTEVKRLKERFPSLDGKIIFECLRQNNWNSEEAAKVLSSGNDIALKFPVLEPTILHAQKPIISSRQVSPATSTTDAQQYSCDSAVEPLRLEVPEAPKQAEKAHENTTSTPHFVSGASDSGAAGSTADSWSAADSTTVLRAVKIPENSVKIRKLLTIFPGVRADKGIINVLYQCGWDLEKATKRLEDMGQVRKGNGGDVGDTGKLKGKGKGKGESK